MNGEDARVSTRVRGEDGLWWVDCAIFGYGANCPVHAASLEQAEEMAGEIEKLVKATYRKAYRDGFSSCQSAIKQALGIKPQ